MRILGEYFSAAERLAMVAAARALLGKPWGHRGRGPFRYDCLGLLCAAAAAVRPVPPTRMDYGRVPHNGMLRDEMCAWVGEPVRREPMVGDFITWRMTGPENHVGLIGDHPQYGISLIHCYGRAAGPGGGRVIEHGIDAIERRRILEVWSP